MLPCSYPSRNLIGFLADAAGDMTPARHFSLGFFAGSSWQRAVHDKRFFFLSLHLQFALFSRRLFPRRLMRVRFNRRKFFFAAGDAKNGGHSARLRTAFGAIPSLPALLVYFFANPDLITRSAISLADFLSPRFFVITLRPEQLRIRNVLDRVIESV